MNGAMALDWVKMTSAPTTGRATIIGVSHHHLCCQRNIKQRHDAPNAFAAVAGPEGAIHHHPHAR